MPLKVKFVVVENSHTCVTVNLKSQREMFCSDVFDKELVTKSGSNSATDFARQRASNEIAELKCEYI